MQDQHDSDFLPWALAAAAVIIMAAAVRINSGDPGPPRPAMRDTAPHNPAGVPAGA